MKTSKDKAAAFALWQSTPLYVTKEGLAKLQKKLAHLKSILPGLIEETARTAAYGDRSENVEYVDAKARLRRTHGQIFRIEDQLKKVKIISEGPSLEGAVQIGSTVVLGSKTNEHKTFRIVGPHETDPKAGLISYLSPLGAALLGHKPSEIVTFSVAGKQQEYTVLEVR